MGRRNNQGRKERNRRNRHGFIYERDAWTCMMPVCYHPDSRAIDPALNGQSSHWAPSVDHIVPLAVGGTNDRRNLRAAHQLRNTRHGNRLALLLQRDRT